MLHKEQHGHHQVILNMISFKNLKGLSNSNAIYNTKYVIPRCKTATYQQSFIIRACRSLNALVDELKH